MAATRPGEAAGGRARRLLDELSNLGALKAAGRAAIVMPSVFAFADTVIRRPQTSFFAAFGSFVVLVFVEFGGRWRRRLVAYVVLAGTGVGLIALGTVCSRDPWIAAATMALLGWAILFGAGVNGYLAAGANGAILLFVLPANLPAPSSAIPGRLLGWCLAASVGTAAAMLLWPARRRADLRRGAAGAIRAIADLIEADPSERGGRSRAAAVAVGDLARRYLGAQHRASGPTAATAALVTLPEEIDWLVSLLVATAEQPALDPAAGEEAEVMAAAAALLRASAARLEGGDARADFERLDRAQAGLAADLARRLPELAPSGDASVLPKALETPFRVRVSGFAARQLAVHAMQATEGDLPVDEAATSSSRSGATRRVALEHASLRSVWLQSSVRGAVALALAVFVAQRTGVQHGFWVVLGTLSVLRSNALGTGRTIVSALAGTAAGIVVGAALVVGIGTHRAVLWAALPVAVALAAYAPRAISFAAGQAGFTALLLVLFNLIQPVGWSVGVVRLEDVAIGFAVSLGVGLLFWPRGAAGVLRVDLAAAYAQGADFAVATLRQALGAGEAEGTRRAAAEAAAAVHRLEDSFRQYFVERSASRFAIESMAALVGGAARVRHVGQSLDALAPGDRDTPCDRCGAYLDGELRAVRDWYFSLGRALAESRRPPPPHRRDLDGRRALLDCVGAASRREGAPTPEAALAPVWALEHLEVLRRLEAHVAARASAVSSARRPRRRPARCSGPHRRRPAGARARRSAPRPRRGWR